MKNNIGKIGDNYKFIVFEGMDGSGQSSQAQRLLDFVKKEGMKGILTKEPTNTLLGGILRSALIGEWKADPKTLQMVFAADRLNHCEKEIKKIIDSGGIVVCDRYILSSIAYGVADGINEDWLLGLNQYALLPDVIIYIDVPMEISLQRIHTGRFSVELFEHKDMLAKVRKQYLRLAKMSKFNVKIIDGTQTMDEVHHNIIAALQLK